MTARKKTSTPLEELQRANRRKSIAFARWVKDPANGVGRSEVGWFLNASGWGLLTLEMQCEIARTYVAARDRWPTAHGGGVRRRKLEEMVTAAVVVADSLRGLAAA